MTTPKGSLHSFVVRQVSRGFWTYDIMHNESAGIEYSVGECGSRRDAEKRARAVCRDLTAREVASGD